MAESRSPIAIFLRGQLDAETTESSPWPLRKNCSSFPSGDARTGSPPSPKRGRRFGVERLLPTSAPRTPSGNAFSETPPTFSLRKEVILPQVLLRLPCYDFTPIMNHTLGRCPPCGSARGLLVQSTFVM